MSPEQEETASLISTGTLVPEGIYLPPPGYQLVPEHQWEQLQLEGRQQQESLQQLQRQLDSAGQERDELQEALKRSSEDCAKQVQVLLAQVQNSEKLLQTLQGTVSQAQERAQQQMAELAASHKRVCYEIKRLNEENQGLRCQQPLPVGSRVQEQEQVEEQELPTSPLELQQLIRSTRQEARECRRAQEHEAERLRIEIVTLREALEEETTSRASLERERRLHREETEVLEASLCSLRTEMERIQQERSKVRALDGRQSSSFRHPRGSRRAQLSVGLRRRLSSQAFSQNKGQKCFGFRLSWRRASKCRGTLFGCPRPCRYAWRGSARQRPWTRCATLWMRRPSEM
uniref:Rab GTPase-binding effector protein 2 n=1 Tax=Monodelphis domestica TaxID=13616 RepID=F6V0S5_MONDO